MPNGKLSLTIWVENARRKAAGKKGKPAAGSPDRENPYDVLFA